MIDREMHRKEMAIESAFRAVEAGLLLLQGEPIRAGLMTCSSVLYLDNACGFMPDVVRGLVVAMGRKMVGETKVVGPSHFRGHPIRYCRERDVWVYSDNGEPVPDTREGRPCGHCGKDSTPEGHDGCLGTLEGVQNACCGHGVVAEAYVKFDDGSELREEGAVEFFKAQRGEDE